MRGTGSNDFVVDNVFVPSAESTTMATAPHTPGPLYAFPPLYLVSHAGVPLGIARSALDFVEELSMHKPSSMAGIKLLRDDPVIQETIARHSKIYGRRYVPAVNRPPNSALSTG
jgi:indole-3-acetate monooxygenase